jgi:hypothetical protein
MKYLLLLSILLTLSACAPKLQTLDLAPTNVISASQIKSGGVKFTKNVGDLRTNASSFEINTTNFIYDSKTYTAETEGFLICIEREFTYQLENRNIKVEHKAPEYSFEFDNLYVKTTTNQKSLIVKSSAYGSIGPQDTQDNITEEYLAKVNVYKKNQLLFSPLYKREFKTGSLNNCSVFVQEILNTIIKN